jgi:hypothetical protein
MPKQPKDKGKPPTPRERLGANLFGAMLGLGALPAQVRLASREQQSRPVPFVPPKSTKGKRR